MAEATLDAQLAAYTLAFAAGLLFAISDVLVRLAMGEYRAGHMLLLSLAVGTPILWLAGAAGPTPQVGGAGTPR
ncbi:MAG: hypothetical protein LRS49_06355 [Desulfurococcales archaeon]|nr:hypothetical protein [Desulfurococcales archaeon]